MTLCEDCIHAMIKFDRAVRFMGGGVEYLDDPYYYCDRLQGCSSRPYEVRACKYRQTEEKPIEIKPLPGTEVSRDLADTKYRRSQQPEPQIPGKVHRWDCCTISEKCLECEHYHNPSEGTEPHKCPFGLRQRLRRIG